MKRGLGCSYVPSSSGRVVCVCLFCLRIDKYRTPPPLPVRLLQTLSLLPSSLPSPQGVVLPASLSPPPVPPPPSLLSSSLLHHLPGTDIPASSARASKPSLAACTCSLDMAMVASLVVGCWKRGVVWAVGMGRGGEMGGG